MKRFNFYLHYTERDILDKLSHKHSISKSEVIRKALWQVHYRGLDSDVF